MKNLAITLLLFNPFVFFLAIGLGHAFALWLLLISPMYFALTASLFFLNRRRRHRKLELLCY